MKMRHSNQAKKEIEKQSFRFDSNVNNYWIPLIPRKLGVTALSDHKTFKNGL
jgi:hypothetical protein